MKKILFLILTVIIGLQSFAQIDLLRQKLDSIFQYIDKTQIPTGYLKEYGAELMPIHCFNGVLTDSNAIVDIDCFRTTYTDLATAKIQLQLPLMKDLTFVNSTIDSLKSISAVATPVAILYGNYASLRNDALSLNLFYVINQQVHDVAGRSQSPYVTNTLFAAAGINKVFTNTVTFTYKPVLYYTNTSITIADISVDFKDGQGFHIIPVNGTVSKTYTDSSSRKTIDFRAHLSTGGYVYCHSSADVFVTNSGIQYRYIGSDPQAKQVPVPVVAGEGLGGDTMQIRYSINNPTRTNSNPHLRKPLIYVEGYDISGKYNILNLISDNIQTPGEWVKLTQDYDFMHYLDDVSGYDLVFINYNTLRSFEDNSKMLQHVIEWVKQDKTAGGYTEQNVMIGVSAGGVLARYTLARMTKTISSESTDTRLLITHDSPHQGANVPLAFQHFLYDLGNVKILGNKIKDNLEDLKNFFVLNTLPATAELLRARVIDENGTVAINTFLNGSNSPYQQMIKFAPSDHQPIYRFIATAQGSQCGVSVMSSNGLPLANYDGDFAIVRWKLLFLPRPYRTNYFLTTQLSALPSTGTQSQIEYFKYSRRFSYWGIGFGTKTLKEVRRNNPTGFTDWDAAPGSTQSINDRTDGSLNTGLTKQKLPWYATPFVGIRAGLNMNVTQDLFSFVSTTSALDAPTGTSLNTVYLFQNTGTSGTSSQKYIAQEKFSSGSNTYYNQNHTDFTARNSRWIYNEMQDITQPIDCNDYCDISSIPINGSNIVCGCNTYTINGLTPNTTVTWNATPSGYVTITPNGSSVSVCKIYNGNITLTATISGGCGNGSIQKQIYVGTPTVSGTYSYNGQSHPLQYYSGTSSYNSVCNSITANTNMQISGASFVNWQRQSASISSLTWNQSGNNINFYFWSVGQTEVFRINAANTCGTTTHDFGFKSINCSGGGGGGGCSIYQLSPNPATSSIQVSIVPNIPAPCDPPPLGMAVTQENTPILSKVSSTNNRSIQSISIYDNKGQLQQQQQYNSSNKKATLNVSNLPSGIYFVNITDVAYTESHRVVIDK
jgi:hypothetical protein